MSLATIILKEKISGLGAEGDIVKVRPGYARNFLLPQKKALEGTAKNLANVAALQEARVKREAEELIEAQKLVSKVKKLKLSFTLKVGNNAKAFGSVTTIDIAKALSDNGINVDRHAIMLDKPIKTTGKQEVVVNLHAELPVTIKFNVVAEGSEAPAEADEDTVEA
jgi:large subunit ribosomal protein L9